MEAIYISDTPLHLDDGSVETVFLVSDDTVMPTLKFLQTLVDGLIECVSLTPDLDMWVNEEGLFRDDFEINRRASIMAGHGYVIKGPAVITGQRNGETISITPEDFDRLRVSSQTYKVDEIRRLVSQTFVM